MSSVNFSLGQLSRTFVYKDNVITLHHDTISGNRILLVNYVEISIGNTNMFSKDIKLDFVINNETKGFVEIKKQKWSRFIYSCTINNETVKENMQIEPIAGDIYETEILDISSIYNVKQDDDFDNNKVQVVWYEIKSKRLNDNVITTVHRRFNDFVYLNSMVKRNIKGYKDLNLLPLLPDKVVKSFTNHNDHAFIINRKAQLEQWIRKMLLVPHVSEMFVMGEFLGIFAKVRETSLIFNENDINITFQQFDTSTIINIINCPDHCNGLNVGDAISKINGETVTDLSYDVITNTINTCPRPVVLHFIQILALKCTDINNDTITKFEEDDDDDNYVSTKFRSAKDSMIDLKSIVLHSEEPIISTDVEKQNNGEDNNKSDIRIDEEIFVENFDSVVNESVDNKVDEIIIDVPNEIIIDTSNDIVNELVLEEKINDTVVAVVEAEENEEISDDIISEDNNNKKKKKNNKKKK